VGFSGKFSCNGNLVVVGISCSWILVVVRICGCSGMFSCSGILVVVDICGCSGILVVVGF
jgi:hypothetical protein